MHSTDFIDDIEQLFLERGTQRYEMYGRAGGVTQLQHALQCADWAQRSGAAPTLVAAALLHDLGHLLYDQDGDEMDTEHDDVHQYMALPFLRPHLPDAVLEPIKLHVDAKRYLCGTDPAYAATLSEGSQRSLELQGGPFSPEEAEIFIALPHAHDAVALRRWDDLSKDPTRVVPPLATYRDLLASLRKPRSVTALAVPAV
jgi:phosphonate degradation associated HDIG domain protein